VKDTGESFKSLQADSKIVDLSQRLGASGERGGELLQAVRDIAARRLQQLINGMFEHVDDALFDLAEKAENNAAQMHYFDGMREVRKRRPVVERSFLAQVSRDLSDFAGQRRQSVATSTLPIGSLELSLVADNELEESLAITSMIGKTEARLARDLFAVNQRLSVICGGLKIDDASNPIGPAALALAFRTAMRELNADMRVKLIIYKLFDRYALAALDELYRDVNDELIRAGVLPQLRREVSRATDAASATGEATPAPATGPTAAAAQSEDNRAAAELLDTLRSLFNARRAPAAIAPSGTQLPLPTVNELVGALSVLQNQAASGDPVVSDGNAASVAHEVQQLKQQLLAQIGSLRGERPSHVATIDEDTIDLVGMLFEFILEDRNLPAEMQALLGRLQIPYLKAAILDRKLFAHRQHPARRLLDSLAEVAKSWSLESDRDGRLQQKVKSIVDRLLHEFDDDLGIFERLCVELQDFQDAHLRRAGLAEQRVAESTRGREKLDQARRRAARETLQRIGDANLPPLVHGVLTRAWANHLVLTILRQGETSSEFREALRFIDEFIASTRPAPDVESRRTLRQMLPGIERALRRGLANVAFQEQDIERLLAQLHTYYRQQLGEAVPAAELAETSEPAPLPIPENMQPVVAEEPEDSASMDDGSPAAWTENTPELQQVRALKPGAWIEFDLPGNTAERAKLSWISPMSGRYLFVNRRGLKVGDFAPAELAGALIERRARVLEATPLFDRAMDAIVGRLSQPPTTHA